METCFRSDRIHTGTWKKKRKKKKKKKTDNQQQQQQNAHYEFNMAVAINGKRWMWWAGGGGGGGGKRKREREFNKCIHETINKNPICEQGTKRGSNHRVAFLISTRSDCSSQSLPPESSCSRYLQCGANGQPLLIAPTCFTAETAPTTHAARR